MGDSYRGRPRGSESYSRVQHYSPAQSAIYASPATAQYAFGPGLPASSQSTHAINSHSYLAAPASPYGHHRRKSSGTIPQHTAYSTSAASERAPKRQKAISPDSGAYMHAQWADASVEGITMFPEPTSRGARPAAYNASGYPYSHHDPYGQESLQAPSFLPSVRSSSTTAYTSRHSHTPSTENEEDEEDVVDHGPTELPPRTYTGKSKYDPPRKPGKIPGSAMDYLPILEARFDRLETAIDRYVDYRGQRALSNSILPGSGVFEGSLSREGSFSSSSRHSYSASRR